jgi:hypothetical protein
MRFEEIHINSYRNRSESCTGINPNYGFGQKSSAGIISISLSKKIFFLDLNRNLSLIILVLMSLFLHLKQVKGQNCSPETPSFYVDLNSTTLWTSPSVNPSGACCGLTGNVNCVELVIKLPDDGTSFVIGYTDAPGNLYYSVDCGDSFLVPKNKSTLNLCFDQPGGTHTVNFCRNGNPPYMFTVAASDPNDLVSLNPFSPVCVTDPAFVLSGGSPQYGIYYINGQQASVFNPATRGTGIHTITYVWEDEDTGCSGQATQQITVGPLEQVIWTGQEFCDGAGWVSLDQATPPGGVYFGNLVASNQFDLGSALPGVYPTQYTYTDALGCYASKTADIVVHELPNADAGPDQFIDKGMSTILNAASGGSGSYSYHWSPEDQVLNPNIQMTMTEDLDVSTLITLTVTDNNSGCQASDYAVINIWGGDVHISALIPSPPSICYGQSTELWAIPGGGSGNYNYFWEADPPDPTLSPHAEMPVVSPIQTTRYYVTISDADNPLDRITTHVDVTVHPLPNVTLDLTPPVVCANTPGTSLSGGFPMGGNYSLLNTLGDPLAFPYINFANFIPHHVGEGNYLVKYEYTDPNGCTSHAIHDFEILPYVKAEFYTSLGGYLCIQ